jgi:hypothetical protein
MFVVLSIGLLPTAALAVNADLSSWTRNLSEGTTGEGFSDDAAEVAVSGNTVHAMWLTEDTTAGLRRLYYRRSTDGGKTWQARQLLHSDNELILNATYKRMAVDGNNVHIVVSQYDGSWYCNLIYLRSTDGGATFDAPATLFTGSQYWHIYDTRVSTSAGKLTIGFRHQSNDRIDNHYLLLNSADGGSTFATRMVYNTTTGSGWNVDDLLRSGDRIYVLYRDTYYYYGMQSGDLYLAASDNDGASFVSQRISVPSANGNHKTNPLQDYHYAPKIAAVGANVYVVWNGLDETDAPTTFYRRSTTGGVSFDAPVKLSTGLPSAPRWGLETIAAKGNNVYTIQVTDGSRVFLQRSNDSGASFAALQELTGAPGSDHVDSGWWPVAMADPNVAAGSKLHVLWNAPRYVVSTDSGATISGVKMLSPQFSWAGGAAGQRPQIAIGADGVVHWIAQGKFYSGGVFGDFDIFYRRFAPPAAPAAVNNALQLNTDATAQQYDTMQIPASASVNFTSAMTVEAWVKVVRPDNTDAYFIHKTETGAGGSWGSYMLGQWRDGTLDARIATTDGGFVLTSPTIIPNDTWTHVAMTYNATAGTGNLRIYINGQLVNSLTATGNLITGDGPLLIGSDNTYRYTSVALDELRFWNRALTATELLQRHGTGLTGTESGLTAYYGFDNTTKDLTGRGNEGVLLYRENFVTGPPLTVTAVPSVVVPAADVDGSYTLSWGASTTGGAIYQVQEATDSSFTSGLRTFSAGTALSAAITGRSQNTTYYYRVRATKPGYAASDWCNAANSCAVPGTATVGIPASLTVPVADVDGAYAISWSASTTIGATYELQEATSSLFNAGLRTAYRGTATTANITGRPLNQTYYYRVRAVKAGLKDSGYRGAANSCAVPGTAATGAPASLTVPVADTDGAYTISWGASTTTSATYELQEATNSLFTAGLRTAYRGTATTANMTGRPLNQTYYYRVRAVKAGLKDSGYRPGANGCVVGP